MHNIDKRIECMHGGACIGLVMYAATYPPPEIHSQFDGVRIKFEKKTSSLRGRLEKSKQHRAKAMVSTKLSISSE